MRRAPRFLYGWSCRRGHAFLHAHAKCPTCGEPLNAARLGARGRLIAVTTVRVNPTGEPFRLGIARLHCGATTICLVRGAVRQTGTDRVALLKEGDRFVAVPWRVSWYSWAQDASDGDLQRS